MTKVLHQVLVDYNLTKKVRIAQVMTHYSGDTREDLTNIHAF